MSINFHKKRDLVLLLLVVTISFLYIQIFGIFFFRDYSIIFDGALRITHGQVPYRDFFLPVGPVALYFQAIFHFLLGPNALAMSMGAGIMNSIVLGFFFWEARKTLPVAFNLFLVGVLHFCYIGATVAPWYNHTALFFYFIAQFLVLKHFEEKRFPFITSILLGLLASLALFSKQDIGLLGTLFIFAQLLFFPEDKFKTALTFCLAFGIASLLIAAPFAYLGDFEHWFNYGQSPHSSRSHRLAQFFSFKAVFRAVTTDLRWQVAFLPFLLTLLLKAFNRRTFRNIFLLSGMAGFSIIVSATSGQLNWTSYFSLAFIGLFLTRFLLDLNLVKDLVIFKRIVLTFVAWLVFPQALHISNYNAHALKIYYLKELVALKESHYERMRFYPEIAEGIYKIKALLNGKIDEGSSDLLIMSAYTFLYADLKVVPPTNTHLWYHKGVTLFDEDLLAFKERLKARPYKYILFEEMVSGSPEPNFKEFLTSIGYHAVYSIPTPKSGRGDQYDVTLFSAYPELGDTNI